MRLKRLELSGFKSFAKTAKLEFPAAISAIVGPNGSGKSNVAEAMRWVLGEQSIKSLRGKKGEDLIFNGSQTVPRMGRAFVSLVFDNHDKVLPVDFDEVKITRKVYRDGTNEYFVNNSQTRLKDIIELLGNIGLGASSHHIISQGEADRILSASPKERRQMIEDALGLKIHQLKKIESERKLAKTEDNILQVEALKREIQPHLRFLKKQVEKARESLRLKEDLKRLYRAYFRAEGARLGLEEKSVEEKKRNCLSEVEKIKKEMPDFSDNRGEEGGANKIREEGRILREKLAKLDEETRQLRAKRNSLERELGRFEGMIQMEEGRRQDSGAKEVPIGKIKEFAERLKGVVETGLARGDSLEGLRKALEEIRDLLKSFISGLGSPEPAVSSELDNLKNKKEELLASIGQMEKEERALLEDCAKLRKEIARQEESIRNLEKEKYEMKSRLSELSGVLSGLNIKEENIKTQRREFEFEKREASDLVGEIPALPYSEDPVQAAYGLKERDDMRRKIERLKIKLEDSGSIGGETLKEYEETRQRDEFFEKELGDLKKARESLVDLLKELEEKINSDFKEGVDKINKEFKKFFVLMFGGGDAELKIVSRRYRPKKENDDLSVAATGDEDEAGENGDEGVEVSVSLPKKRISSLDVLSGGERALTSIALLFAMSQVNPPPFLILDETDAALDEANSRRYGSMLRELSERAQLIVITHNRETMKQAGVLYGVTMGSDSVSKLLSIKFAEAEKFNR